jgi:hypothetical protein
MGKPKLTFLQRMFRIKDSGAERYDAFISYRRETGSDLASLLKIQLENKHHKRIFLDVKELQVGRFDEMLLSRIGETPNFILILSRNSLDRCTIKTDWLKREIMQALETRRNIIPVLTDNFSFPSDEVWNNLPPEMRVLLSLNGIQYNHLYQDPAIEKINAFMKSEMRPFMDQINYSDLLNPSDKKVPLVSERNQPTLSGPAITKKTSGATIKLPSSVKPDTVGEENTGKFGDPKQPDSKENTIQPIPEEHINVTVSEGLKQPPPVGLTSEPYFPIKAVLVRDLKGNEIELTEFGSRVDDMGKPVRDFFQVERNGGKMNISWNKIDSVAILKWDDIMIQFWDGKSLDHVKPGFAWLTGIDDMGFIFKIPFDKMESIILVRDRSMPEADALMRDIPLIVKRTTPNSAYSSNFKFEPDQYGILVTHDLFLDKQPAINGHTTFRMPGPHTFIAGDWGVSMMIASKGSFNLSLYDRGIANVLAHAFNRLNSLMYAKYESST